MKSNAPWSVKGIEKDARETAKAAAQREGMTVGEWLNQIIYSASDPDAPMSGGEIEGLRARDLAAAIEHLSKRIAVAESKGADAVDNLARSLGGAVERLQRLERAEPTASSDAELADRVRLLEEKGTDRQRIEALRALERAVGQIAVQFSNAEKSTHSRLDAAERQLHAIAGRIETASPEETVSANAVREAIEGMAARVARAEKIAAEATQIKAEAAESVDADFIQKTGLRLRILGDEIKRGGDQMRTLETTITRLSQQIDAAEKRSAEGVQKVAETIADLREQFSSADATDQASARAEIDAAVSEIAQRTEDRIEGLQRSFDDMVRRLEAAGAERAATKAAAPAPQAFVAEPEPQPEAETAEFGNDIDSELEDAFAALDLEEPVPTPAVMRAPEPASDDEDDFGFELEEPEARGFDDDAQGSAETDEVLAEIREAFGIDAPEPNDETTDADEDIETAADAEIEELSPEPPPIAVAPDKEKSADYLRAARLAAREAAAKAAEEQDEAPKKRKLTPKQRAILAARLKRRKAEALAAKEAEETLAAPAAGRFDADEDEDDKSSIKARVSGLLAKIKLRGKSDEEKAEDAQPAVSEQADDAEPASGPNVLSSAGAAFARVKKLPVGALIGLVGALALLGAAMFLMFKDSSGGKARRATPTPAVETPAANSADAAAADSDRISPAAVSESLIRPRDLYLENISKLKNATTDADARDALGKIEEAAALGHPPAQLQIGELYKLGQLYDRDLAQARTWFERAANGGNVLAMHRLGVMAARGEGGPIDPQTSITWFEKAANFGLVDSQYNLGATFHPTPEGAAGGVQDRAKAFFWYSVAAKNGDAQAGEMADGLASSIPADERAALDADIAAWSAKTPDPAANELPPTE
ncbi:MAG: hypothetical protein R3C58_10160 [Parvularculaceae bacterium]